MSVLLPSPAQISHALSGISNKSVSATQKKPFVTLPLEQCFVCFYDDGMGTVECATVMDIQLAASLGAALALIPAAVAKEAARDKKLEGDMLDNAFEVANILANSFLKKRVRLIKFVRGGELPEEVKNLIAAAKQCLQVDVTVSSNYPGGLMAMYAKDGASS